MSKPRVEKFSGLLVPIGFSLLLSIRLINRLVFEPFVPCADFERTAFAENKNATLCLSDNIRSLNSNGSEISMATSALVELKENVHQTSRDAGSFEIDPTPSVVSTTVRDIADCETLCDQKIDHASALTPAQVCRLEIETWLNPMIDNLLAMGDTMPPLIDWVWDMGKYVLVNLKFHRVLTRNRLAFLNGTWHWQDQFGNNFSIVEILGKRLAIEKSTNIPVYALPDHLGVTMARLQIPPSTNSNERSVPVSLWVSNVALPNVEKDKNWVYDLHPFLKCDKIENEIDKPVPGASVGMCVKFRGDHHLIPPFLAYHRLIGVDHFWMYTNEPFNISDLPYLPYVTYVPYRFVYADHARNTRVTNEDGNVTHWSVPYNGDHFWQQDVQQQCLYRSKRYGLNWLMTNDIDEYLWLNKMEKDHSNARRHQEKREEGTQAHIVSRIPKLKRFLQEYEENDEIGALAVDGWAFGRMGEVRNTNLSLPFDYCHRTVRPGVGGRTKLIYRVPTATRIGVHWLLEGGTTLHLPISDIRWNHYRSPTKGIFKMSSGEDLVCDTSLPTAYRNAVLDCLRRYNITGFILSCSQ